MHVCHGLCVSVTMQPNAETLRLGAPGGSTCHCLRHRFFVLPGTWKGQGAATVVDRHQGASPACMRCASATRGAALTIALTGQPRDATPPANAYGFMCWRLNRVLYTHQTFLASHTVLAVSMSVSMARALPRQPGSRLAADTVARKRPCLASNVAAHVCRRRAAGAMAGQDSG